MPFRFLLRDGKSPMWDYESHAAGGHCNFSSEPKVAGVPPHPSATGSGPTPKRWKKQVLFKEGVKCLKFKSEISVIAKCLGKKKKKYIIALNVVHTGGPQSGKAERKGTPVSISWAKTPSAGRRLSFCLIRWIRPLIRLRAFEFAAICNRFLGLVDFNSELRSV